MNIKTFNKLVALHQKRVYSLALYILRNNQEAEDITQDVFTRLWNKRDDIDETKYQQWLSTVTRNACIDKIRQRKEYIAVEEEHMVTKAHQEPAGHMANNQLSKWLEAAISSLKEPYSSLILMCDVHNNSQKIAASQLNLSINQVKVYLHRARQELKVLIQEHLHE